MKFLSLLICVIVIAACGTNGSYIAKNSPPRIDQRIRTPEELLVGKWLTVSLVRVVDGVTLLPQEISGDNISEFKTDGTWSSVGPYTRSAGSYRWISNNQIEQTIVESNLAIQLGLVSIRTVIVDDTQLEFSIVQTREDQEKVLPPPKQGVRRLNVTMVIMRFKKITDK